ncbi:MAG: DUF4326 domain-containing protein [Sphingomonas sp.]|nr:DUF4326 domain-containing protein [Sphingomonas sp.]MDX3885560.1 DUF4326 domain-containing protein [Sphingomonas sp.]
MTTRPQRLQRTRRNRDVPENATYVGRGSFWATPFLSTRFGHARAVGLHRAWFEVRLTVRALRQLGFNEFEIPALYRLRQRQIARLHELRGRDLICWCSHKSRWCHSDTLIRAAARLSMAEAA